MAGVAPHPRSHSEWEFICYVVTLGGQPQGAGTLGRRVAAAEPSASPGASQRCPTSGRGGAGLCASTSAGPGQPPAPAGEGRITLGNSREVRSLQPWEWGTQASPERRAGQPFRGHRREWIHADPELPTGTPGPNVVVGTLHGEQLARG